MFIDEKPSIVCLSTTLFYFFFLNVLLPPPAYPLSNGIGPLVRPLTDLTVKRNIPSYKATVDVNPA